MQVQAVTDRVCRDELLLDGSASMLGPDRLVFDIGLLLHDSLKRTHARMLGHVLNVDVGRGIVREDGLNLANARLVSSEAASV